MMKKIMDFFERRNITPVIIALLILGVVGISILDPFRIMAHDTEETAYSTPLISETGEPTETPLPTDMQEEPVEQTTVHSIAFTIPENLREQMSFEGGGHEYSLNVLEGESIPALPDIVNAEGESLGINVWSIAQGSEQGNQLSTEAVMALVVGGEMLFEPVILQQLSQQQAQPMNIQPMSLVDSIAGKFSSSYKTNIVVLPSPDGVGEFKSYPGSVAGFQQAMGALAAKTAATDEFTVYIGTSITVGADINTMFSALEGKVKSLAFVGSFTDPANSGVSAPGDATVLTLPSSAIQAKTALVFRNIQYDFGTIYMNGYDLVLAHGSYYTSTSAKYIYGGAVSGDVTAKNNNNVSLTINSTGKGGVLNLFGGSYQGKLKGNIYLTINDTCDNYNASSKGVIKIHGGGYGTSANIDSLPDVSESDADDEDDDTDTGDSDGGSDVAPPSMADIISEAEMASVMGDVHVTINKMRSNLGEYYGGVHGGIITGTVYNTIKGQGAFADSLTEFYGGSSVGSIGTMNVTEDAIVNDIDTSGYTMVEDKWLRYTGANKNMGFIYGNVRNRVKAGDYKFGAMHGFSGGGAKNTSNPSGMIRKWITIDPVSSDATIKRDEIEKRSKFRIYGDIINEGRSGCFLDDRETEAYGRGAGYGGYISGNVISHWGTEGLCYGAHHNKGKYTAATNIEDHYIAAADDDEAEQGHDSGWWMANGGGLWNDPDCIYIKGNSEMYFHNILARRTSSGGFGGVIEGNTYTELNKGIVDNLCGGGYRNYLIKGNTKAKVTGGQVDWFLAAGGYGDRLVNGNISLEVTGGIINASLGAAYGRSDSHTVKGDSDILVTGGNFSGVPRKGPNSFSGGMTNKGWLKGNTRVTLDFRNATETFTLPASSIISGGRGADSSAKNTKLGVDSNSWIELNVFTKAGNDVLASADIYGDGGGTSSSARNNFLGGKITINVDAPGSTIGDFVATKYPMATSSLGISNDITFNIKDAKLIGSINGAGTSDSLNNTIFDKNTGPSGNPNRITVNVGYYEEGDPRIPLKSNNNLHEMIEIGKDNLVNFTDINVSGALLYSNKGSILNGRGTTSSAHKSDTNKFGDVLLENNGGIGVFSSSSIIVVGKLTVKGKAYSHSYPGAGRFVLSDFEPLDGPDGSPALLDVTLSTEKVTLDNRTGTWFGANQAFTVFTFNPVGDNAKKMTPLNMYGRAGSTTLIGDNDVTGSGDKYGIMIPGSFYSARVEEGEGSVMHDVDNVTDTIKSGPIHVYGNVSKNTPVQELRLAIPKSRNIKPTITFTPETAVSGSWVKKVLSGVSEYAGEQPNSNPVKWTSTNTVGNFILKGYFTNKAEVDARSIIIKQSEAKAIANTNDLIALNEGKGRPFFGNDINNAMLEAIKADLNDGQMMRVHEVTYGAGVMNGGVPTSNYEVKKVNVIVVPDATTVISPDKHYAIFAVDTSFSTKVAAALADIDELNSLYTRATVIKSDATTDTPVANSTALSDIKAVVNTTDVNVTYTYDMPEGGKIQRTVVVRVVDEFIAKINTTGYETLDEAIAAGIAAAVPVKVELLIDVVPAERILTEKSTTNITISTAAKTDSVLPYKGKNDKAVIMFQDAASPVKWLVDSKTQMSRLTFEDVILDGSALTQIPEIAFKGSNFLTFGKGSVVRNFHTSGPLIQNEFNMYMKGTTIQDNLSDSNVALIYNTASLNVMKGGDNSRNMVADNTASAGHVLFQDATNANSVMADITIENNKLQQTGYAVYVNRMISMSGYIKVYNNLYTDAESVQHQRNIFLNDTITKEPYGNATGRLEIGSTLDKSSKIGVTTDKSTENGGKGILYTIIARNRDAAALPDGIAEVFTHDQLQYNADAYQVVADQRSGYKNLVLGYNNAVDFNFRKVNASDMDEPLAGAEFNLYTCTQSHGMSFHADVVTDELLEAGGCWQPVMDGAEKKVYLSDSEGRVDFGAFPNGKYMLVESKAPEGFMRPVGQWLLEIDNTQPGYDRIIITAKGQMMPPAFARTPVDDDTEKFLLPNMMSFQVINTGGWGIARYILGGSMIIIASMGLLIYERRHKRMRKDL